MPLYEYLCDACGHRFEKIQKFSDPLIDECPNCGAKEVHKLVSSPAIQFKGTGWYITDYAKKNTVDAAKAAADSGDSKGSESKGGDSKSADAKTSESKADSKTESKTTESKSTESKSSDSKSSDSKSSESKSSDTKSTTTSST
jgi:putative FmdB family regulatory protein